MALSTVTEGAASAATDLNQVVNLLNGTTTNTQMTVNGPVGANMSGTTGYMRYVGGLPTPTNNILYDDVSSNFNYAAQAIPTGLQTDAGTFYQNADMAWPPGGPIAIGNATLNSSFISSPAFGPQFPMPPVIGMGGYAARIHQSAAITYSASNTPEITGDTIDYDPRGMVQPYTIINGNGPVSTGSVAITLPFLGIWGFACAIHSVGVNSMPLGWTVNFAGAGLLPAPAVDFPANSTHKYTGACWYGFAAAGGPQLASSQVAFLTTAAPASPFSIDVSGPDRTYIAVWLIG
jgi:hypothetical protein